MTKSSGSRRSRKAGNDRPAKPYAEFPLYAHPLGYWSKKIRGDIVHFGRWGRVREGKLTPVEHYEAGWTDALTKYKAQVDDLQAGRTPRTDGSLTVKALGERFCQAKLHRLTAGEIAPRTFNEYRATAQTLADVFGKNRRVDDLAASDFEQLRAVLAGRVGPVRLGNEIGRVKSILRYALDNGLIDRPVRTGGEFKKPGKSVLRKHRAANGGNMMEAAEIRRLLTALEGKPIETGERDAATGEPVTLTLAARADVRAMVLVMVNCAFGPMDLATLPLSAVDLDGGWIDYPRPKTGIPRRCPLWPETVAALRAALADRPTPRQAAAAGLVFLTARGRQCISGHTANPITILTTNAMKAARVHREGRGPYTMRHVFRTVADEIPDRPAVDRIMGHADGSMAAAYRERIADARLKAVTDHVRAWLFPSLSPAKERGAA